MTKAQLKKLQTIVAKLQALQDEVGGTERTQTSIQLGRAKDELLLVVSTVQARAPRRTRKAKAVPLMSTEGHNTYCGPTAIAAVTGVDPVKVEDEFLALRKQTGLKPRHVGSARVKGVWPSEIVSVVERLGFKAKEVAAYGAILRTKRPTFRAWQRKRDVSKTYLVIVTGHLVAVSGRWFTDTKCRKPVRVTQAPWGRKRVSQVFEIERA